MGKPAGTNSLAMRPAGLELILPVLEDRACHFFPCVCA